MKREEIRIGETYRIRELDDLVAEFGMIDGTSRPLINTPCILSMNYAEEICGMPFTPKRRVNMCFYNSFGGTHNEVVYESEEKTEEMHTGTKVYVTADMLEPFDAHKEAGEEFTAESLMDFLFDRKEKSC